MKRFFKNWVNLIAVLAYITAFVILAEWLLQKLGPTYDLGFLVLAASVITAVIITIIERET